MNCKGRETCEFRYEMSRQVLDTLAQDYLPLIRKASIINSEVRLIKHTEKKAQNHQDEYDTMLASLTKLTVDEGETPSAEVDKEA